MKALFAAIALAVTAACAHDAARVPRDTDVIRYESPVTSPWPAQSPNNPMPRQQ